MVAFIYCISQIIRSPRYSQRAGSDTIGFHATKKALQLAFMSQCLPQSIVANARGVKKANRTMNDVYTSLTVSIKGDAL